MKAIYLIVGKSGSGKTSIVNALEERYGYKQLLSYTTRKPRSENEKGHIFVEPKDFNNDVLKNIVAFTVYKGNYYWATNQQVEESDLYVIDPKGVQYFKERYKGDKKIITIEIDADDDTRKRRMLRRGDSEIEAAQRIENDMNFLDGFAPDFIVHNNTDGHTEFEFCMREIAAYIYCCEMLLD